VSEGRSKKDTKTNTRIQEVTNNVSRKTTWLTPFGDTWIAAYGGKPSYGQIAKAFKPLVDEHGTEKVLAHWAYYLDQTDAQFASPARFASTFGRWTRDFEEPSDLQGFRDEDFL